MDQHAFSALCQHVKDSDMIKQTVTFYIEKMVMTFVNIIGTGLQIEVLNSNIQVKLLVDGLMRYSMYFIVWHPNLFLYHNQIYLNL